MSISMGKVEIIAYLIIMYISRIAEGMRKARSNLQRDNAVETQITETRRDMGMCATLEYSGSIRGSRIRIALRNNAGFSGTFHEE